MPQSRRWTWTLNRPTADEIDLINAWFALDEVVYAVFGHETGASGTPHLQGFTIFRGPQRLTALKLRLPRCHFEPSRGTSLENRTYCRKDGDSVEFGTFPAIGGHRSDLDELLKWSEEFEEENGRPASSPDVARHQPRAYLKFPRFARLCNLRAGPLRLEFGTPNVWQAALRERLAGPADDRTVNFYVDPDGGKGKTWFIRWFLTQHHGLAQVLGVGKRDDIAHMVNPTFKVYLFNVPRGGMEFLQYTMLEQLKDKIVVSPKYNSQVKVIRHNVHVVVFCNELPDESKMSQDRFNVVNLE